MKRLIKRTLWQIFLLLRSLAGRMGYEFEIRKTSQKVHNRAGTNLNIAAGRYVIDGFISLDFFSDHYYRSKSDFDASRIHYDIRKDAIPYGDGTVDNIYISHAIEHVETEHVERLFREAFRVLRPRGVLRIACPDARFLYQVSSFENGYWAWREPSVANPDIYDCTLSDVAQSDYLTRELATPKMRFYRRNRGNVVNRFVVGDCPYEELMQRYREGLQFSAESPGDHINNWDFERLRKLGQDAGFARIIESKCQGSISREMQGEDFDRTAPQMSLYVDFMK